MMRGYWFRLATTAVVRLRCVLNHVSVAPRSFEAGYAT